METSLDNYKGLNNYTVLELAMGKHAAESLGEISFCYGLPPHCRPHVCGWEPCYGSCCRILKEKRKLREEYQMFESLI